MRMDAGNAPARGRRPSVSSRAVGPASAPQRGVRARRCAIGISTGPWVVVGELMGEGRGPRERGRGWERRPNPRGPGLQAPGRGPAVSWFPTPMRHGDLLGRAVRNSGRSGFAGTEGVQGAGSGLGSGWWRRNPKNVSRFEAHSEAMDALRPAAEATTAARSRCLLDRLAHRYRGGMATRSRCLSG